MNEISGIKKQTYGKDNDFHKTVFLSYKFADDTRFELVRRVATKLRFFSIEVVVDQRNLDFGDDIKEFMRREISHADAMIIVLTKDYNEAISRKTGPGDGVRFEVQTALEEKAKRASFQIIPLLLDGIKPIPPFDKMKCGTLDEIDEIVTQLGLTTNAGESRVLRQRYRIDKLIETRGVARIFHGWDMVLDIPNEIYLVPHISKMFKDRFDLFERVVKGRSSVSSPFLLNVRDTHIDSNGGYYLITERFDGNDLGVYLQREGNKTHPFGALCIAYQTCLALYELHSVGVIHGGLAPRCIRLNPNQTSCKITDFEFATPLEFMQMERGDQLSGYPIIMPPERFNGYPISAKQDFYQIGNLMIWLICGKPVISSAFSNIFETDTHLIVDDNNFPQRLYEELEVAVENLKETMTLSNSWIKERVTRTSTKEFLKEQLVPFLTWCLAPQPEKRPRNCIELLEALKDFSVPPIGHLVDPNGEKVNNALFFATL